MALGWKVTSQAETIVTVGTSPMLFEDIGIEDETSLTTNRTGYRYQCTEPLKCHLMKCGRCDLIFLVSFSQSRQLNTWWLSLHKRFANEILWKFFLICYRFTLSFQVTTLHMLRQRYRRCRYEIMDRADLYLSHKSNVFWWYMDYKLRKPSWNKFLVLIWSKRRGGMSQSIYIRNSNVTLKCFLC